MFVGLDVGYGQTKLSYAPPSGLRKDLKWPSGAAPIDKCALGTMQSADGAKSRLVDGVTVDIDGQHYGALLRPDLITDRVLTLHSDYATSPEYMALAVAAISQVPSAKIDVLVTGLPVSHHADASKREALRARLCRKHAVGARTINVLRVEVVPQGLGAFVASADVSEQVASSFDTVLVVDVGHYSVDWVVVSDGRWRPKESGSSFSGTHTILQAASSLIRERDGLTLTPDVLMRAVVEGKPRVEVNGIGIDVQGTIRHAADGVVRRVVSGIRSALPNGEQVTTIVLTGGGAPYYKESLQTAFPKIRQIVHPKPAMANAIGFQSLAEQYGEMERSA